MERLGSVVGLEIVDAVDRVLRRGVRSCSAVLRGAHIGWGDLLALTLPLEVGRELNFRHYATLSQHFSEMSTFFSWEEKLFEGTLPPPPARVLIGAAGAGREAELLLARGYQVACFEPVRAMTDRMRVRLAERCRDAGSVLAIECCSYEELLRPDSAAGTAARDALHRAGPFDICMFGWGSVSLIFSREERAEIIRLFRSLCPAGPILLSWIVSAPHRRSRERLRRVLGRMSGRTREFYYRWGAGFYEALRDEEIAELSRIADERIAFFATKPYGHALFMPTQGVRERGIPGLHSNTNP